MTASAAPRTDATTCTAASASLHAAPDDDATAVSALLYGEAFAVLETAGDWARGMCVHDGYAGWVRRAALADGVPPATHRIVAPSAAVFAAADIKTRVVATLPLNARIAATAAGDFFAAAGGYVHRRHVGTAAAADPVALALGFVGTPYVWGGRTRDGIDCSGLTQAVLLACGVESPRDSGPQRGVGQGIAPDDRRRGDLVFLPGHVGILADRDTLVHANAFWMATTVEPLADVTARLAATAYRRPAYRR